MHRRLYLLRESNEHDHHRRTARADRGEDCRHRSEAGDRDDLDGVVADVLTAFFDTIDPEALEGVKRGLADVAAGREIRLEEYATQHESQRRQRGTP